MFPQLRCPAMLTFRVATKMKDALAMDNLKMPVAAAASRVPGAFKVSCEVYEFDHELRVDRDGPGRT